MSFFRRAFALCLVAVWLLATQHCGLEAAGLVVQGCEQSDGQHGCGAEHAADGCQLVENTGYKTSNPAVKVPPPQLVACLCLVCVNALEPATEQSRGASLAHYCQLPRGWVPTWRFAQRTALLPGAPALV